MRVAIAKPRRGWGGGTTMALAIARGLRARGHEVVVFCHKDAKLREEAAADGFAVEPVLYGREIQWLATWRVARALRRHRVEVLLSLMTHAGDLAFSAPAAQKAGIPVVARRGLTGLFERDAGDHGLVLGVTRYVAVSHAIAREIRAALPAGDNRVTVIHNGTDLARIRGAVPARLGLPEGALAIGFVGRLHTEKGILELAQAWRRVAPVLPDAHLAIVGAGDHEERFRAELADAPRVHWLGFRKDVAPLLRAFDLLVLPTHIEGFPNTIVEAMAAGTPVLSTTVEGPVEAVRDGETGRLVRAGDVDALATALVSLATDPAERARLAAAASAHATAHFDRERMLDAYERVLEEAAARPAE